MQKQKTILCIHDLSCAGRCSLSVILPVLAAMGHQPIGLPTLLLSGHTGGLGAPATVDCAAFGPAALEQFAQLGIDFDCIFVGYLGGEAGARLAEQAFARWPKALKVVDPVMADHGRLYSGVTAGWQQAVQALCRKADLILPNYTEALLLLGLPLDTPQTGDDTALAQQLHTLCPSAIVTGVELENYLGCVGSTRRPSGSAVGFTVKKLRLPRSFPGTGDLFAAVLIGCLLRGNALEPAVDAAAEFVSAAIQATPAEADSRFGVSFEPLLHRLAPPRY